MVLSGLPGTYEQVHRSLGEGEVVFQSFLLILIDNWEPLW
jgi:hypothetical protein